MTRRLVAVCLLVIGSAVPAFAQTHLTFIEGGGQDRGASGATGTFDSRAVGMDRHLDRHWWLGVEGGVIGHSGNGFRADALLIPVNLYAYLPVGTRVVPFVTFGYTSVMIIGAGLDAGAGVDVTVWKNLAVRAEVRGITLFDKSGSDGFACWRVGGVLRVGRD